MTPAGGAHHYATPKHRDNSAVQTGVDHLFGTRAGGEREPVTICLFNCLLVCVVLLLATTRLSQPWGDGALFVQCLTLMDEPVLLPARLTVGQYTTLDG